MPERDKSVVRVSGQIVGAKSFDGLTGAVRDPYIPRATWNGLQAIVDIMWVEAVKKIDWNRVLLTAEGRHRELLRMDPDHGYESPYGGGSLLGMERGSEGDAVCGECMIQALLTMSTVAPEWDKKPERDAEEDKLWREEWIEDGGGHLSILQAILPHMMKAAHEADGGTDE